MSIFIIGCEFDNQTDRALLGGGIGSIVGAAIGNNSKSKITGALIGGAGGALTGAITTAKKCVAYDKNGNAYKVICK